jgi:hypothetical protein
MWITLEKRTEPRDLLYAEWSKYRDSLNFSLIVVVNSYWQGLTPTVLIGSHPASLRLAKCKNYRQPYGSQKAWDFEAVKMLDDESELIVRPRGMNWSSHLPWLIVLSPERNHLSVFVLSPAKWSGRFTMSHAMAECLSRLLLNCWGQGSSFDADDAPFSSQVRSLPLALCSLLTLCCFAI